MGYKKSLEQLLKIYNPPDLDWMGYLKTNENYYTFHHIEKKAYGGKADKKNGAILTVFSHKILHLLETYNYELFTKWNELFKELNKLKRPLNSDDYIQIFQLKNETDSFIRLLDKERSEKGKSRILQQRF